MKLSLRAKELDRRISLMDHLFSAASVIPWEADWTSQQFTFVGPQAKGILGHSTSSWKTPGFYFDHIHPEDRQRVQSTLRKEVEAGNDFNVEFRMIGADGRIVHLLNFVHLDHDSEGKLKALSGYMFDVSDKRNAELLLAGQRKILELLAQGASLKDSMDSLVHLVEHQCPGMRGSVLLLNPSNQTLQTCSAPNIPTEYSAAISGSKISPRAGSCGTAAYLKKSVIVEDIETNPLWESYKDIAIKNGLRACWSCPILSKDGKVLGTFAMYYSERRAPSNFERQFAEDTARLAAVIIEHARIRDELKKTVSILNSAIEATGDGILVVNRTNHIISFNQNFVELWRLPESIIEQRSDAEALTYVEDQLIDPIGFKSKIESLYADFESESFDIIELKDGRVFERYSKPHTTNDEIDGRVWSFRDVTKRRWTEKEAESANLAKNHFLANISHEIRTPLNAVLGFSEMLVNSESNNPNRMSWVDKIHKSGELLLKVVDEILDISKTEVGKMELSLSSVNLPCTVRDIVEILNEKAKAKGLEIDLIIDGAIPKYISSDRFKVQQILINVIGNAIKFTDKGSITVRISYPKPELIAISVKDTGIGIPADKIPKLFRPFEQGDMSFTRRFGGAGLGLALSRRMAQALGGDVTILSSIPGVGSEFVISFRTCPIAQENLTSSFAELDKRPQEVIDRCGTSQLENADELRGTHILLVDDSEDNQILIPEFLRGAGVSVDIACNGAEGVEKALSKKYDLILMDMQMPIKDGFQATRELRMRDYSQPILALTAHALPGEKARTLEAGCNDHLTKPVSRSALIHALHRFLPMRLPSQARST